MKLITYGTLYRFYSWELNFRANSQIRQQHDEVRPWQNFDGDE